MKINRLVFLIFIQCATSSGSIGEHNLTFSSDEGFLEVQSKYSFAEREKCFQVFITRFNSISEKYKAFAKDFQEQLAIQYKKPVNIKHKFSLCDRDAKLNSKDYDFHVRALFYYHEGSHILGMMSQRRSEFLSKAKMREKIKPANKVVIYVNINRKSPRTLIPVDGEAFRRAPKVKHLIGNSMSTYKDNGTWQKYFVSRPEAGIHVLLEEWNAYILSMELALDLIDKKYLAPQCQVQKKRVPCQKNKTNLCEKITKTCQRIKLDSHLSLQSMLTIYQWYAKAFKQDDQDLYKRIFNPAFLKFIKDQVKRSNALLQKAQMNAEFFTEG